MNSVVSANLRLSAWFDWFFPTPPPDIEERYFRLAAEQLNSRPDQIVVDVGGGRKCPFASLRNPRMHARIIAVDTSAEELALNLSVDETRVADASRRLPFAAGEVDLITSRSVLQHLPDLEIFLTECYRVLRPGGAWIHLFPCRFATFSLAKQVIPRGLLNPVIRLVHWPRRESFCWSRAYYHRCYPGAIESSLRRHGFNVVETHCGYEQSHLYRGITPLYITSRLYEAVVRRFGLRSLCAYVLVTAAKPIRP